MFDFSNSLEKLTIAEAVELLKREGFEVTANMLRQYESQKLVSPEKDSKSKYRLYSDSDLMEVRKILSLLLLGFSIKEIKTFFELGNKAIEIINSMTEVDKDLKASSKLEDVALRANHKEFMKWTQEHVGIITKKWSTLETNKNCLILSRFSDFYNRITERIKNKKRMLETMKNTYFDENTRSIIENIFHVLHARTTEKPPV
jgi:DNA-binding transcriptional MerR regulator